MKKTVEETGRLIGNEFSDKIPKFSRISEQCISKKAGSEAENIWFHREIPEEWYIPPEHRQIAIDRLRLIR